MTQTSKAPFPSRVRTGAGGEKIFIVSKDDGSVLATMTENNLFHLDLANLFVTAINSHEDLLEALEGAAKTCHICDGKGSHTLMDETEICQSPGSSRQDCQFCAPYRAAIKAAQ